MSFDSPIRLLALLVLPLAVGLYLLLRRRRARYAMRFTNLDLLSAVARELGARSWRRALAPLLLLLVLAALALAAARPSIASVVPSERATVVLVLDVSGSMQQKDVRPTRLAAAEQAIRVFLRRVPRRLRLGLIVFAGESVVAAAPSPGNARVRAALAASPKFSSFANSVGGTAIGDALALAVRVGQQSLLASGGSTATTPKQPLVSILLLSDGQQSGGQLSPSQGAREARKAGIPVYTVALGSSRSAASASGSFDLAAPGTLSAIAAATGGRFVAASSAQSLRTAYDRLGSSLGRTRRRHEISSQFVLAAAALLLGAGLFSRGALPLVP